MVSCLWKCDNQPFIKYRKRFEGGSGERRGRQREKRGRLGRGGKRPIKLTCRSNIIYKYKIRFRLIRLIEIVMNLLNSTCSISWSNLSAAWAWLPPISLGSVSFEQLSLKELQEINEEGCLSDNKDTEDDHQACNIIFIFQMKFVIFQKQVILLSPFFFLRGSIFLQIMSIWLLSLILGPNKWSRWETFRCEYPEKGA